MTKQQILKEIQDMVPRAIEHLRWMLEDHNTPPAVRMQLIDLVLRYGLEEKVPLKK